MCRRFEQSEIGRSQLKEEWGLTPFFLTSLYFGWNRSRTLWCNEIKKAARFLSNPLVLLVGRERFERSTYGLRVQTTYAFLQLSANENPGISMR